MPSYETLDAIADSNNPLLALLVASVIVVHLIKRRWRQAGITVLGFLAVAGIAYGERALDHWLSLWSSFGLDYSTHTAEALGLVVLLSLEQRKMIPLWLSSLFAYFLLMLYQRYHSLADIVTTTLAVSIPLAALLWSIYRATTDKKVALKI